MKRRSSDDRGAAVVEFALVLPLLALMITLIVQFGFLYQQRAMFNNAAAVAARDISINDQPGAKTRATAAAQAAGAPSDAAISFDPDICPAPTAGINSPTNMTVTVTRANQISIMGIDFGVVGRSVARCSS